MGKTHDCPKKGKQWQYVNVVIAKFMHTNRLRMNMESRIHGDVYVRFGGEYVETWRFCNTPPFSQINTQ